MSTTVMSAFAHGIMQDKYAHVKGDGTKETWEEIATRVATNVMAAVNAPRHVVQDIANLIAERKFMPGGRYLYAAGRPFHQTQNCLLMRADDSREGWSQLMHNATQGLMTGAGIGVVYSDLRPRGATISKTGGVASGPTALMQMVNETGRHVRQGGSRRSAIWAGLHWNHPDVFEFMRIKDWAPEVRLLKSQDFDFPATLDGTNVSVILDDEFFLAYDNPAHPLHTQAQDVYWTTVKRMLKTAEPGFSVDVGVNKYENLRNAPVVGTTHVLTSKGYAPVNSLVGVPTTVWTGKQWAENVVFTCTKYNAKTVNVVMTGGRNIQCDPEHPFLVERYVGKGTNRKLDRIIRVPAGELQVGDIIHVSLPTYTGDKEGWLAGEEYSLGYIYGDGSFTKAGGAEITFCTPESRDCLLWAMSSSRYSSVTYPDTRGYARVYFKVDKDYYGHRDKKTFPVELFSAEPVAALSFIAGLFDADGNYEHTQRRIRLASKHFEFLRDVARLLEQYGILAGVSKAGRSTYGKSQGWQLVIQADSYNEFVRLVPTIRLQPSTESFTGYRKSVIKVLRVEDAGCEDVYCADVKKPEHSFMAEGVIISNCTEVTSEDDSDICNLGSINLARIGSITEMQEAVELATMFLLAGTVYSHVPYPQVDVIRSKNRRLGLGLMGIHEWLLLNNKQYGEDDELGRYLEVYATSTATAEDWAYQWGLTPPVKTRAIAPTGTIGIVAETTTGIEPIFCAAFKRRYWQGDESHYQYVLDPTAKKLVEMGMSPDQIEDAYTLAENVERRVSFQRWVQKYVDHAISSTINLPEWGSALNNEGTIEDFGNMLLSHLPGLRGVTCYPDGARGGQPLNRVDYREAAGKVGEVFIEQQDVCDLTKGGTCGI